MEKTYYALILGHKNIDNIIWLHPTVYEKKSDAELFKHRDYDIIKIIEFNL